VLISLVFGLVGIGAFVLACVAAAYILRDGLKALQSDVWSWFKQLLRLLRVGSLKRLFLKLLTAALQGAGFKGMQTVFATWLDETRQTLKTSVDVGLAANEARDFWSPGYRKGAFCLLAVVVLYLMVVGVSAIALQLLSN